MLAKDLILLAESGSSKTDWVLIDTQGKILNESKGKGYNPYFVTTGDIVSDLEQNPFVQDINSQKLQLFFYGAGCSDENNKSTIYKALMLIFPLAEIFVEHDLLAAARACYNGSPVVASILGTGSSCCYFDGNKLIQITPSLGYVLGDEGAGSNLGRTFITDFLYGNCPPQISHEFESEFGLSKDDILTAIYQKKKPNTFLAQFAEFLGKHQQEEYVKDLLHGNFRQFIKQHIIKYRDHLPCDISFVGSVAYYFKPALIDALTEYGLEIGEVLKSPKEGLIRYHIEH